MDYSRAVAAVLVSPQGQAAVASGEVGALVRLVRNAAGWRQQELADRSGWSQATISRLERGVSRAARDVVILTDIAQALGVPPAVLGVPGQSDQPPPILDGVERRDFLDGAAGLAVTVLLPQDVTTSGRIDADQAAQCWTALRRLFELDDRQGGATVGQVAERMAVRLREALRRGSYVPSVGRELRSVTAATMEHAGWLAYDAGWQQKARHWWLEACHLAELADIPDSRVTALASMALQASDTAGGGREAVDLVQAARTEAGGQATPILLSLLAAREAVGHARIGDRTAAASAVAEAAARRAFGSVDADAFPRNHTSYASQLGLVLIRRRQLDEAIAITSDAVRQIDMVRGSGRIVARLKRTVDMLAQQDYRPAKTFANAARRLVPAAL